MSARLPEGTLIREGFAGTIMIAVYYPYRKSPDCYMRFNGDPLVRCLQCDRDMYAGQHTLIDHIRRHDRRKRVQRLAP